MGVQQLNALLCEVIEINVFFFHYRQIVLFGQLYSDLTMETASCGLLDLLLDKLQRVQNAAVRVVEKASHHDLVPPILETLHWLPVLYSIQDTNNVQSQSSTCT